MTNPTPHGQVPRALRLAEQYDHGDPVAHGNAWKAAVCTELRRQHTRIAELGYELEAVGAGGVQALSAAPAEQEEAAQRLRKTLDIDPGDVNDPLHPRYIAGFKSGHAAGRRRAAPAASPTPPAEQQASATEVALVGAYARLPDFDSGDEPIWEAVFKWKAANPGSDASKKAMAVEGAIIKSLRDFADRTHALRMQAAPKAAPGVGNSGFDHQTAADFLSGKTVSDEAVRKFVAASRWAHDERAALSATLLAMHGVLTSREAEIAHLKKALLDAEAAPQQEAQEPVAWESTTPGFIKYITQARYEKFSPNVQRWYKPYKCSSCAAPQPAPAPLSDDTKRLDWMDKDAGERVFHVGADWYTRPTYGQPYRKHKNLRAAIDAALAAQRGNK